jgi:mono/diheme cytochrome c family protein
MAGKQKPSRPASPKPGGQPAAAARPAGPGLQLPFELPDKDGVPTINFVRLWKTLPWLLPLVVSLGIVSFIPLSVIYYNRTATHKTNRWSLIPDMDNQPKWRSQQANLMFADHRASRAWPEGTVRADAALPDAWFDTGIVNGEWATGLPPQVVIDGALLARGKERYHIYCSVCHGEGGYGDGPVAQRADRLKEGTWTSPLTYHGDQVRNRPVGHIFNTITNGIRTMPAYGTQIPAADRWAIIAWIRVLQASQSTDIAALPADRRAELEARKPAVAAPAAPPAAENKPAADAAAPAEQDAGAAAPPAAGQEGGH